MPLEQACEDANEDSAFLGAISTSDMATRQQADSDLRALINHIEGRNAPLPQHLARGVDLFCLRNGVLYKNTEDSGIPGLLVMPEDLRNEVLFDCHDEPTSGHIVFTRTL